MRNGCSALPGLIIGCMGQPGARYPSNNPSLNAV